MWRGLGLALCFLWGAEACAQQQILVPVTDARGTVQLHAQLYRPQAPTAAGGRLPAVAIFHGCGGVGANNSVTLQLRLLPLTRLHAREPKIRPLMAELRRGGQGLWVEARAEPGQLSRPVVLGVGVVAGARAGAPAARRRRARGSARCQAMRPARGRRKS
mgnify:CR=1 FL=1